MKNAVSLLYTPVCTVFILMGNCGEGQTNLWEKKLLLKKSNGIKGRQDR